MLDELSASGLLSFYSASGKRYLHVNGWTHQKIDKPTFKFPPFDPSTDDNRPEPPQPHEGMRAGDHVVDDAPPSYCEGLAEDSPTPRVALTPGREREGKGYNTHTPAAPFEMHLEWQPDETALKAYALMSGVPFAAFTREAMAPFVCHHEAKGLCKTEKEWVSDLVGWIKRDRLRDARVVPLPAPAASSNWAAKGVRL